MKNLPDLPDLPRGGGVTNILPGGRSSQLAGPSACPREPRRKHYGTNRLRLAVSPPYRFDKRHTVCPYDIHEKTRTWSRRARAIAEFPRGPRAPGVHRMTRAGKNGS